MVSNSFTAFTINRIINGTECRIGSINLFGREIKTPTCLQYTQLASIPHIEWQQASKYVNDDEAILLVPTVSSLRLADSIDKIGSSLSSFARVPSERFIFVTIYDYLKGIPHGFNDSRGIASITSGGKVHITPDDHIKMISSFKPNFAQSLCDSDALIDASKKRISHTVNRSDQYLDRLIQLANTELPASDSQALPSHQQSNGHTNSNNYNKEEPVFKIFASIEGGFSQVARSQSTKLCLTKDENIFGYVIEGLTDSTALSSASESDGKSYLNTVSEILSQVLKELPRNKPKALFGPLSPEYIWHFASLGIDMFDSSYATKLTESGEALLIDYIHEDGDKKWNVSSRILKLSEKKKFKEDLNVIEDSCECFTCKSRFSRAYLCHLIDTREMLASTLLLHHNLHILYSFFREIRKINPCQS